MVEKVVFEAQETGPNPPPAPAPAQDQLPENLPANVRKSYEDMRAEITRLQQKVASYEKPADPAPAPTQVSDVKPDAAKPDDQKPDEQKPDSQDDAAKKVTDAAGFDVAPFQQEYDSTGDVSEESRAKIAESLKNVLGENARQIVDDFIESKKVVHTNDTNMYMEAAGGQEQYAQMTQWASQRWSKEQVDIFNRQVSSGDRHATLFAIQSLKAQFEAANGREPSLFKATSSAPSGGIQPYASTAEMVREMSDPRYKSDPAFREKVTQRLAVTR